MTRKLEMLKEKAESKINELELLLTKNLPKKGDYSNDCSYTSILNTINDLRYEIDSITNEDMTPSLDWKIENERMGYEKSDDLVV